MRISQERLDSLIKKHDNKTITREEVIELRDNIDYKKYNAKELNNTLGNTLLPLTIEYLQSRGNTYNDYQSLHWFERSQLLSNQKITKDLLVHIAVDGLNNLKDIIGTGLGCCDFEMSCNHSKQEERTNVEILQVGVYTKDSILDSYVQAEHTLPYRVIKMFGITQEMVDNGITKNELINRLKDITDKVTLLTYGEYDSEILNSMRELNPTKVDSIISKMFNISPLIALILNIAIAPVTRNRAEYDIVSKLKYYHQLKGNVSLFYLNLMTGIKPVDSHKAVADAENLYKVIGKFISCISYSNSFIKFKLTEGIYNSSFIRQTLRENSYELTLGKLNNTKFIDEDKYFDEILDIQKKENKMFTLDEEVRIYKELKLKEQQRLEEQMREREEAQRRRREKQSCYNYDDEITLDDIDPRCVPPNWFFD